MTARRAKVVVREAGHRTIDRVRRVLASERERRVIDWQRAGHDRTLRLDYDLDASATVVDVGGWEGQWASDVFARFCCTVHVLEPNPAAAAAIERRFAANPRIHVHPVGLGAAERSERLLIKGQGSSTFSDPASTLEGGAEAVTIRIVAADAFLSEQGVEEVDLLKVNIEGGEYELLDHLLATGWVRRVKHLQVQFHDFVPDAERRMDEIQRRLSDTHDLAWQCLFVWEGWTRRAGGDR